MLGVALDRGDERLVPVAFHVRPEPEHAAGAGELAGQVERGQAGEAGGVAGVGLDHLPGPVVAEPFERRRAERDPGRARGVVGLRVGVFDPAGQAEDQAIVGAEGAQAVAEVEHDAVLLGVADPAVEPPEAVDGLAVAGAKRLGHVDALEVGRGDRLDGGPPGEDLAGRPGPFGGEPLVGGGRDPRRPVDHLQDQLVEVGDLVHRLGDHEAVRAVDGLELVGVDGDGLVAVGLAVDAGGDEVAEPAAAEEVAQAGEAGAVPGEEDGATAGLAVVLDQRKLLVGRDVQLALHRAVGPADPQQGGRGVRAEPEDERPDRLRRGPPAWSCGRTGRRAPALRASAGPRARAGWCACGRSWSSTGPPGSARASAARSRGCARAGAPRRRRPGRGRGAGRRRGRPGRSRRPRAARDCREGAPADSRSGAGRRSGPTRPWGARPTRGGRPGRPRCRGRGRRRPLPASPWRRSARVPR